MTKWQVFVASLAPLRNDDAKTLYRVWWYSTMGFFALFLVGLVTGAI